MRIGKLFVYCVKIKTYIIMKTIHVLVIAAILCFVGLFYCLYQLTYGISNERKAYEKHIGERIVIEKDTLLITDYSMIKENYTLSNGQEVSYNLVINSEKLD